MGHAARFVCTKVADTTFVRTKVADTTLIYKKVVAIIVPPRGHTHVRLHEGRGHRIRPHESRRQHVRLQEGRREHRSPPRGMQHGRLQENGNTTSRASTTPSSRSSFTLRRGRLPRVSPPPRAGSAGDSEVPSETSPPSGCNTVDSTKVAGTTSDCIKGSGSTFACAKVAGSTI